MLSFDPPYAVIDGYTILPDHEDPAQWYVVPRAPALALDAGGRPELSILDYLGGGAGADRLAGAVCDLSVTLSVPDEVLGTLAGKLRDRLGSGAPTQVRLSPVLFDAGGVELIVLGQGSQPADPMPPAAGGTPPPTGAGPGTAPPKGPFDVRFQGTGRPSLGGDNRASFQLVLDQNAAQLLDACLDAPDLPVLVVYRMLLSGLRPSFSIKVEADWSKVYRDLENRADLNVWYVAADAEAMVKDILEHNNVTVDETVFGSGPEAAAAAERARKYLVDWVMSRLFTPLVDPAAATANAIGEVVNDTVFSLTRAILPGLGYKLRYVSDDELRTMSARMDETVAERREIVPQGTVGGLLNALRVDGEGKVRASWPALRASLVRPVNLADFPRLEVEVGVEDRFTSDGISEVVVELARPGDGGALTDQASLSFRSATDRQPYVVNLLGRAQPSLSQPYRWRAEVRFDPTGPFGPHAPVATGWRDGATASLTVEPREAYQVPTVRVAAAPTFSWSQFPTVDVDLRYRDGGSGAAPQHQRLTLVSDQPSGEWRFRAVTGGAAPFAYAITYERPADQGGLIAVPERVQVDELLTVPDPLPRKRRLNIFVSLPWSQVNVGFLELRYRDDPNGIRSDEQIDLSPDVKFIRKDIPIAADGPMTVSYRLTVLFSDGRLLEGSWWDTEDDRLVVDHTLVDSRVVTVRTVGGTLAANHLSEVHVRLKVDDPLSGQVRAQTSIVIERGGEETPPPSWEYLAGDPPAKGVRYQGLFIDEQGFPSETPWALSTSGLLVVQLSARKVSG